MKRFYRVLMILAVMVTAVIALALTANAEELKTGIGIVEANGGLRLREEPTTDSDIITTAYNDESVVIIEKVGDWYKVNYNLKTGYMHGDYLYVKERENIELGYGLIDYDLVNIRSGPSTGYSLVDQAGYGENAVGFAVKEITDGSGNSWTSIYSAVPCLPADIIRNILKHCGCHIYDGNSSDVIYADNSYVSVHSLFGGEKTVELPGNYTVYDVFNRKVIAENVNSFTYTAEKSETRLFRIGKGNGIKLYFTRTSGGTVSPEGISEVKPGDTAKVTFKAENGYRLAYLLIDGIRTTVNGDSYTFKNINASHTLVAYYTKLYEKLPEDEDPYEPGNRGNNGSSGGYTPDKTPNTPDNASGDDVERRVVTNKNTKYYTTVSLNLPLIIAMIAGAAAALAALLFLLLFFCGRNVIFLKNGKRIAKAKVRKKGVKLDGIKKKHGLEGVSATVKKRYAEKHAGKTVSFVLEGAPYAELSLEKNGENSLSL